MFYDWSTGETIDPASVLVDGVEATAGCVRCDTTEGWADLDFSQADVDRENGDPSVVASISLEGVPYCRRVRGRVVVVFGVPRRGTFVPPIMGRPVGPVLDPSVDPGPRYFPKTAADAVAAVLASRPRAQRGRPRKSRP